MSVVEVRTLTSDRPSEEFTLQIYECLACGTDAADTKPSEEAAA